MVRSSYPIEMEIAGNTAMWTRPDTGDCPVSYPAPTYSATKAIFESVLWGPDVEIIPTKVELCAPIQYHSYCTNYGGPLQKSESIKDGNNYQLYATVLIDVCYRLYAEVVPNKEKSRLPESAVQWDKKTTSPGHAYQSIFERRLKRGQCYSIPALGWKEFTPSYFGEFRDTTQMLSDSLSVIIPSMLRQVFSKGYADRFVISLINKRVVNKSGFIRKENGAIIMDDDTRKKILSAWQERKQEKISHPFLEEKLEWGLVPFAQAMLLARFIRGDLDAYPPFLWK